jgi:glycosyltransferase involved in cell wall biosynthesis
VREEGLRGAPVELAGLYAGPLEAHETAGPRGDPVVVFAGRHIREKRAELVPAAVQAARRRGLHHLRGLVLGDGPERPAVLAEIAARELEGVVDAPGFVDVGEVDRALATATCLLLPSSREGYGLVVIEAAASGTPSVLVAGEDNAAVELVEDGVNGYVVAEPDPERIAEAIAAVHAGGTELRDRTAAWFREHAERLSARESARQVAEVYASARS